MATIQSIMEMRVPVVEMETAFSRTIKNHEKIKHFGFVIQTKQCFYNKVSEWK